MYECGKTMKKSKEITYKIQDSYLWGGGTILGIAHKGLQR